MDVRHLRLFREIGMAVLGSILSLLPLAFWFVWSPAIYVAILVIFALSFAGLVALDWLGLWTEPRRGGDDTLKRLQAKADEIAALAADIDRLTDPRLGRKMARLRAKLWRDDG